MGIATHRSASDIGNRWLQDGGFDAAGFRRDAAEFFRAQAKPTTVEAGSSTALLPLLSRRDPADEDRDLEVARAWARAKFDSGFGWLSGPREYGGAGLPPLADAIFNELQRRFGAPDPSYTRTGIRIVGPTLERFGTRELKERYLAPVMRGDVLVCQLFSEPDAGSDLAAVRTEAHSTMGGWLVTGQKVWSSGAAHSDLGQCLLAITAGQEGERSLSALMIDMHATGVEVRPIRQMTGAREFCEVFLDQVFVPEWALLGSQGEGWRVVMDTLNNERAVIGTSFLPTQRLLDDLIGLSHSRSGGRGEVPRELVKRAVVALRVTQFLSDRLGTSASSVDSSLWAIGKISASNSVRLVAEALSATIGLSLVADGGESGGFAWSDFVLAAPGLRLGGGTDEILRNVVAERALGLPREARLSGSRSEASRIHQARSGNET